MDKKAVCLTWISWSSQVEGKYWDGCHVMPSHCMRHRAISQLAVYLTGNHCMRHEVKVKIAVCLT
jgi:hypothetical protein